MDSADPRERADLCGRALAPEWPWEELVEEYDPETWYEGEDGTDYCCREVWDGADDGRCIWHADVEDKPADALATAQSAEPARLDRAVLRESDLRDIALWGCRLRDADLGDADLRRADLGGADLWEADLGGADLWEADLGNANLIDADLGGADLWEADLGGADLRNADLGDADLPGADLGGANLQDSRLTDAAFQDADLTDADLERADCTRANLFDADLTGARLYGAVLANVQLNTDTTFGGHYTGDAADPEKAAWTLRQLERLFRENALPGKARDAYLDRKDRRRRQYWHRALVPGPVRRVVAGGKAWARRVRRGVGGRLKALVTGSRAGDDGGGADETTEATAAVAPGDLSWGERLVATVQWARAAGVGVTTRYAASPWRVVGVSLVVVAGAALLYPLWGLSVGKAHEPTARAIGYPFETVGLLAGLGKSVYFSVITFTTLGYGDVQPLGHGEALATAESFVGAFLLALLVYVFGRRATR